MKIAILGCGLMGGKLGVLFARAGLSYSRRQSKLDDLARQGGATASSAMPAEAAAAADVILLAVHWARVDDVLAQAGDLAGKTLVCR